MREIKFRFWNEQAHKYHYRANQVMPCLENQVCLVYDYTKEGCAFEQFTGLHDCTKWQYLTEAERAEWTRNGHMPSEWKGREIYEGDILLVGTYFDREDGDDGPSWIDDSIHEVKWMGDDDYPAFDLSPSIDTDCNGLAYVAVGEQECEVIGNIHENHELIEASHA